MGETTMRLRRVMPLSVNGVKSFGVMGFGYLPAVISGGWCRSESRLHHYRRQGPGWAHWRGRGAFAQSEFFD
jgi:hypothetical protein